MMYNVLIVLSTSNDSPFVFSKCPNSGRKAVNASYEVVPTFRSLMRRNWGFTLKNVNKQLRRR